MLGATESSFHRSGSRRGAASRGRRFAFVFVCQRGDLEIQSALLAASLKRNLRCRHELIACINAPTVWGKPDPLTLSLFDRLGVRTEVVENVADPELAHAIKISCLRVRANAEKIVYLDSDMLCMAPFGDDPRFVIPLNLKPADLPSFTDSDAVWREAYALAGVAFPERRMRASLSGQDGPPLFQGGFIAVERDVQLADAWQDIALKFRADPEMRKHVGVSDLPSLAVAVHAVGAPYDLLNERYQYPLNMRALKDQPPPLFCHYDRPGVIRREPQVNRLVQELASEHGEIASLMAASKDWAPLLHPYAVRPRRRWWPVAEPASFEGPDLVLTEIARSGGGVLGRLLQGYTNVVMVDEPPDVMESLRDDRFPWRAAAFLREARRSVLDQEPMTTNRADEPRSIPRVEAADFVLGVNIGGSAVSRLGDALRAMPDARFVACVRNPLDTIAAWKGAREESESIEDRARRWLAFAEEILKHRDKLVIVRYDDLVARPKQVVNEVLAGWRPGKRTEPIRSIESAGMRELLDDRDREVIRTTCGAAAKALGLDFPLREGCGGQVQ